MILGHPLQEIDAVLMRSGRCALHSYSVWAATGHRQGRFASVFAIGREILEGELREPEQVGEGWLYSPMHSSTRFACLPDSLVLCQPRQELAYFLPASPAISERDATMAPTGQ